MQSLPEAVYPISQDCIDKLKIKISSNYYKNRYEGEPKLIGYRKDKETIVALVVQWDNGSIPFYMFHAVNTNEECIQQGIPRNIRPIDLFNITKKPKSCNSIFIVDREIDALKKIPGWHGVSWIGGNSKTIGFTDWKKLTNVENIVIWTDDNSAKKIKNRLPHAKIIVNGEFADCTDYQNVFDNALALKKLGIPETTPLKFFNLFIHEFYGDDCLEQRNGVFWIYREDTHHWRQESVKDIKANFQTWFFEKRKEGGGSLVELVESEGLAINKFMNNALEFLGRHASNRIYENPFKDSAISPYIHLDNGLIHLSKCDKMVEWKDRTDKNEDFFRKKYPVHCCDYEFNKSHLKDVSIENAPAFKYVIDGFIPSNLNLSKKELDKTREFFTQIIAYSISPIKPTEYFFGLYGNEGTGKTFFVDVIKDIIGENFFLERPIDEMTQNNKHASSDFWGSKVYVEPDMKTNSVLPEAFIKTFAGQKQITVEKKFQNAERGVNTSIAMFFISNFDFITKGMEGLARRVIYIPFKNSISNPDRSLRDKIKGIEKKGAESGKHKGKQFDERPIILALAMQGWKSFITNKSSFNMPEWIVTAKSDWIEKSDTVRGFINQNYLQDDIFKIKNRSDLHSDYEKWCKDEADKKPYGKSRFYEEVKRMKEVKFKKTGNHRIFEFNYINKPADIKFEEAFGG